MRWPSRQAHARMSAGCCCIPPLDPHGLRVRRRHMKRTRGLTMLLIALVAGAAAVVVASLLMQAQAHGSSKVAVAAVDIEIGARLSPEMLRMVEWPPNSVPPGAFTDIGPL